MSLPSGSSAVSANDELQLNMPSPKKKLDPEVVAEAILKRAKIGRLTRELSDRLAFAQYKSARGWEDLSFDMVEAKMAEKDWRNKEARELREDILDDSYASSTSTETSDREFSHSSGQLRSSPLKDSVIFSDQVHSRTGSGSNSSRQKRTFEEFERTLDTLTNTGHRKRFRPRSPERFSSPAQVYNGNGSFSFQHSKSSPIKPRKHSHFTTASGPSLSFYPGSSRNPLERQHNYAATSDDEDEAALPAHSFNITSSPPRTPPSGRNHGSTGRRATKNGKSGEEGADLLLYLATSPSPANPTRARMPMQPPKTPPQKNSSTLPSTMVNTPGTTGNSLLTMYGGGPSTPGQNFEFSDFVNITPSPAQVNWSNKTPRALKTPGTAGRRRLDFGLFPSPNPNESNSRERHGLGLEDDLLS